MTASGMESSGERKYKIYVVLYFQLCIASFISLHKNGMQISPDLTQL